MVSLRKHFENLYQPTKFERKTLTRSMVSTTTSDSRWLVESRSLDSFAFADSDSSSGFRKLLQYPPAIRHLREIYSRFVSTLLNPR